MAKNSTLGMLGADELRIFLETAQALNMTRAAERIGLSQPALSHAIKRMESHLDTVLFQRSKKGLKLTKSGEKLLSGGQEMLRAWENLRQSLTEDEDRIAGLFKLGCHPSVGMYTLPMFLPELQKKFPQIELQLRHGLSRHMAEDVISGRLDLGIVVNPPPHPDLVIREILKDEVGFWVQSKKKPPQVLIVDPDLLQIQWLIKEMEKKKIFYPRRIETSNLELVRELTQQGCGIGLLPSRVAALGSGLERIHSEIPPYRDRICLVYRVDIEKTNAFKALVSLIA